MCPAKVSRSISHDSDSTSSESYLETSFDFGTESDEMPAVDESEFVCGLPESTVEAESETSSEESFNCESSGEEIWDSESTDTDENKLTSHSVSRVLLGISLFFSMFQLLFHISERAMSALLMFFRTLIQYLAHIIRHPVLVELASIIPVSVANVRKIFGNASDEIIQFVVCPKCSTLYPFSECIVNELGREESRKCSHIEFPDHPHVSRRTKCNTPLMKQINVGGKSKLVPRKTFLYHSIIHTLHQFVQRKDFLDKCEQW